MVKVKESKLWVSKQHGLELKYGSKMTPSYPMKGAKKQKSHWTNHEVEFDVIQVPSHSFMTSKDHIRESKFHEREACKKCKRSSCKSCELIK